MQTKPILALRAFVLYLALAVISIIWMPVLWIVAPFPFRVRHKFIIAWNYLAGQLTRWICGIRYEVKGLENLTDLPVVFFCKHQSAWETLVMASFLPPISYVLKASLLNIPFFGWGLRTCRPIPIDRSQSIKAFKKVIQAGKMRLKQGMSIMLFPEGTRVAPGEHPKFHKTGAALAKATGYPVVLIAHNAGTYWRRNSFLKYPGKVTLVVSQPIDTKKLSVDELNHQAHEWIKTQVGMLEV